MSALQASAKEGIYEVKWLESCWSALGNLFGQKAMSTEALQERFLSLVGGTSWKCECGGCCWRNGVRRSWRTRTEINIIKLKVGLRTDCYAMPSDPGGIINMRWPAASSGASVAGVSEDRLEPAVSDVSAICPSWVDRQTGLLLVPCRKQWVSSSWLQALSSTRDLPSWQPLPYVSERLQVFSF